MNKLISNEEFKEKIKNSLGDEYIVVGNYINSKTKIKMLHIGCGREYEATPKEMTKSKKPTKCPHCFKSFKKDMKTLQSEVDNIFGKGKLEIVGPKEYTNNKMELKVHCNQCNHDFNSKPYRLTSNRNGCPCCYGNKKMSIEEIQEKFDNLRGKNFIKIKDISKDRKLDVEIIECGHKYSGVNFSNLLNIKKCRICSGKFKYSKSELIERFSEVDPDYEILDVGEYINSPALIMHKKCSHKFNMYYYNFRDRGQRCPNCFNKNSIGEEIITDYLRENNVSFEVQMKLDGLNYKNSLSVDFKIGDVYIEYDGEFHFKKQYDSHNLEESIRRDDIKNKFFFERNIKLIRIPFLYKDKLHEIIQKLIEKDYEYLKQNYELISICENTFYRYFEKVSMKMNESSRG